MTEVWTAFCMKLRIKSTRSVVWYFVSIEAVSPFFLSSSHHHLYNEINMSLKDCDRHVQKSRIMYPRMNPSLWNKLFVCQRVIPHPYSHPHFAIQRKKMSILCHLGFASAFLEKKSPGPSCEEYQLLERIFCFNRSPLWGQLQTWWQSGGCNHSPCLISFPSLPSSPLKTSSSSVSTFLDASSSFY